MTQTVVTKKIAKKKEKEFAFTHDSIPVREGMAEFLKNYRENAWTNFMNTRMPNTSDEPWRRTDIRKLDASAFKVAINGNLQDIVEVPEELLQPLVGEKQAGQIIIAPGKTTVDLDADLSAQGVVFCDLATAEREHADLLQRVLGQVIKADEGKFAAMAAALSDSGVLVYVPKNVKVDLPLHSILWGPGTGLAYFSHILIWLEEGAEVTYVHEAASPSELDGQSMHAGLVEIHVSPRANLRFVELQSWGEHLWNFAHKRAQVDTDGNLDWVFVAVGSHLTKDFSDLDLVGEGAFGRMSGFYFTDGNQHLDHDTQQNHFAPNTTSDLLFKGALKETSRSVWQGMIYVAPGAQKTDGYQANRNLVLSDKARADSIPGLEIMADDVRCTHGATVGKIDQDEMFYLLSRGIRKADAEQLIVQGFFDPIMQRIPFPGVQERLRRAISRKMN
jgi:Fe-S cluster assembly protein SufD